MKRDKRSFYRIGLLLMLIFVLSLLNIIIKDYYIEKKTYTDRLDMSASAIPNADNENRTGISEVDLSNKLVMPSGLPIGIYVKTKGVMIIDTGIITGIDGSLYSPCRDILRQGDYVVEIDGKAVNDKKSLVDAVNECDGEPVKVKVLRDRDELSFDIMPVKNSEGKYKLGLWVKDDISGIGTLTYIDDNSFAALGHSINDNDTGIIFKISDGAVYYTNLVNIVKPYENSPGRLEGVIDYEADNILGRVTDNNEYGISGILSKNVDKDAVAGDWISVAAKEEVSVGPAYILSSVSGKPEYYEINITKINYDKSSENKSIELEITDKRLLSITDGIVQGMSGTPIIQNNRLVGAITHVFVNNSTKGYGIFIEYMIKNND